MNQNFSKSKYLHESSKLERFQWGGGGGKFGGKNSLDFLEKKYGNIDWYFCSSIAIFLEFYWKFDNKNYY